MADLGQAWIPLALSLKVALWATALNLGLGVSTGYALARWRFPGRELLDAVLLLPMVLPPTVLGYYLLVLVGRRGVLGGWLERVLGVHLIFTWQGAVLAATVVSFPFVAKSARAAFENAPVGYAESARGGDSGSAGLRKQRSARGPGRTPSRAADVYSKLSSTLTDESTALLSM